MQAVRGAERRERDARKRLLGRYGGGPLVDLAGVEVFLRTVGDEAVWSAGENESVITSQRSEDESKGG